MAAVVQVTKTGPKTYTPAEPIIGGQVVEARAGGRIGVAAAGSLKTLGVALTDAQAPEAAVTTPTIVNGRPVLNAAILPTSVGVSYAGDEVPVVYSVAAAFGDKLVVTAPGQVGPPTVAAGAVPDPRAIVGTCAAPAGVAAGGTGLMRTA